MSEMLEKKHTEEIETTKKFVFPQSVGMDIVIGILISGFIWLLIILTWRRSSDFTAFVSILNLLWTLYSCLVMVFGRNTFEIKYDRVEIKRIQRSLFPYRKHIELKTSEIENVFSVFQNMRRGKRRYNLSLQMKSGKVVDIATNITMENEQEAAAIVETINSSINKHQLYQAEETDGIKSLT